MGKRFTEKDIKILDNKKIVLIPVKKVVKKTSKISLGNHKQEKKENKNVNVFEIIKVNKECLPQVTVSNNHFSVVFEGARLLSINQIFALLQSKKHEVFTYKKSWHNIIKEVLFEQHVKFKKDGLSLPYFDDTVEITLFRQAPKLVDKDALTTMFKYIIDAFKRDSTNPYGILAEDNPKIVHKIDFHSEQGDNIIGIKIKSIKKNESIFTVDELLKE